jgi:uncharacterized caspase-like protein
MRRLWGFSFALFLSGPLALSAQDFGYILQNQWILPAKPIRALAFAPDGTWLVAAASNRAFFFSIGSEGTPHERGSLAVRKEIQGAAISPNGKEIALVDATGTLSLWDSQSQQKITQVEKAHSGKALAVTFTADGAYVVTGGEDGRVRVWTPQGAPFADLSRGAQHRRAVVMVAAVPPARRVISVGQDRQVILWQIDTQMAVRPASIDIDVRSAAVSTNGKTLALGLQLLTGNRFRSASPGSLAHEIEADDRVRLIDADSGTQLRDIQGEKQDLDTVAVTPDGRFVAAAGGGHEAAVWDTATGRRITGIPFNEPVTSLAFAPDGRWMVAGTQGGSLTLLKLSGVHRPLPPTPPQQILVLIMEPANLMDERDAETGKVPQIETPSLRIRGRIKTDGPLKSLLVDGQEITSLTATEGGYIFNAAVQIPEPGRRRIEIVAENQQGATADRSFVVERVPTSRPTSPATSAAAAMGPGRRLALIVGVSRYSNKDIDLQYASADARALFDLLTNPALGPAAFHEEDVRLLLDGEATVTNINKGLREFLRQARENDFVLFFFAGHGAPDPNQIQDLYLLAHDTDPENIAGTGLLMRHVREAIAEIPARDVLILTDSCHSAGIAAPASMRAVSTNPIHQIFLEKMLHASGGLAILTASEAAQVSFENAKWGQHGVFTYFVLQGLQGAADTDHDGIVSLGELMEYVRDHVREATSSIQIPAIGPTSFDRRLPLVIVTPKSAPKNKTTH